ILLPILPKYNPSIPSPPSATSHHYLKINLYTSPQPYHPPDIPAIHLITNTPILFSNLDSLTLNPLSHTTQHDSFAQLQHSQAT
ncbi:hypothetical protein, partial [Paenibacillus xylanexedens]|uniref:hypothetical protein n=1 Tax=Paenibacillus xylanexedens TaxID=528191 RepID=UPI001C92ED91